jgi:hypothetical protein
MSEQKRIDDLFDQLTAEVNQESATAAEPVAAPSDNPASETFKRSKPKEIPTGVWGSKKDPPFVLVSDALEDRLVQMQKRMRLNEDLMMTYLFREEIHEAYYRLWRDDANSFFRSVIAAKHRLKAEREKEKKSGS